MGITGKEVAKQAADIVLLDDNFSSIVRAAKWGRGIFDNIRRFVIYLMSCNVSEILVVGIAVGAGLPPPLLVLRSLSRSLKSSRLPVHQDSLNTPRRHW